jgi:hypothetical protein
MAKSSPGSQSKPAASGSQGKPAAKASAKGTARGGPAASTASTASPKPRMPFLDLSAAPAPLQRAARFMLAGSIGSFVLGAYLIIVTVTERSASLASATSATGSKHLTASQFNTEFTGIIIYDIVLTLVCAALWAWMARMNQGGRSWARIVATVLFLIWTYYTYQTISGLGTWIVLGVLIIELAIWGVGAAALYYLWRPDSTAFFKEQQRR